MATSSDTSLDIRIDAASRELQALIKDVSANEGQRKRLAAILHECVAALETPADFIWRIMLQPHQYAVLRAAIELQLPQILAKSQSPMSAGELAKVTGAEALLIVRLMRVLVASNVFVETGKDTYAGGAISNFLTQAPPLEGGLKFMFDGPANAVVKLPEFLAKSNYKNPTAAPGIFQQAFGADTNLFKWLGDHPAALTDFNNLMEGSRSNRIDWFDFFPVEDSLLDGVQADEENSVLLVDVGGGRGHELRAFKRKYPTAKGQLVLQDLPDTIEQVGELEEGITKMSHDFFTPQPVKGARAYYFRSIFHDWPDDKCRDILRNCILGMRSGYSKIIINDWVLPDIGTPLYPSLLDVNMMACFSSMERTESQWNALLSSVGLEVVKFWTVPNTEGCIEAVIRE